MGGGCTCGPFAPTTGLASSRVSRTLSPKSRYEPFLAAHPRLTREELGLLWALARQHGVKSLRAVALATNRPIRSLLDELGASVWTGEGQRRACPSRRNDCDTAARTEAGGLAPGEVWYRPSAATEGRAECQGSTGPLESSRLTLEAGWLGRMALSRAPRGCCRRPDPSHQRRRRTAPRRACPRRADDPSPRS